MDLINLVYGHDQLSIYDSTCLVLSDSTIMHSRSILSMDALPQTIRDMKKFEAFKSSVIDTNFFNLALKYILQLILILDFVLRKGNILPSFYSLCKYFLS